MDVIVEIEVDVAAEADAATAIRTLLVPAEASNSGHTLQLCLRVSVCVACR